MRNTLVFTALALLLSFAFAPPAAAKEGTTRPEMRQVIQQDYIFTALWEGRLSWTESKTLLAEQDAMCEWLTRFSSDERLDTKEVRTLDYMLDIASMNIDRAMRRHASATPAPQTAPMQVAAAAFPTPAR